MRAVPHFRMYLGDIDDIQHSKERMEPKLKRGSGVVY